MKNKNIVRKLLFVLFLLLVMAGLVHLIDINRHYFQVFQNPMIYKYYVNSIYNKMQHLVLGKKGNTQVLGADFPTTDSYALSVPILVYHGILETPDRVNVTAGEFREQMSALKKAGYNTVSLQDFKDFIRGSKNLPEKSFLLTFDDGRKDSFYAGDPILEEMDFKATIFIISGYSLDSEHQDDVYYLNKNELSAMLSTGRWDIESHGNEDHGYIDVSAEGSKGHFITNKMYIKNENRNETDDEFRKRISEDLEKSKTLIESQLNTEVSSYAYPFGDYGYDSVNYKNHENSINSIVSKIYQIAFTQIRPGVDYSQNIPNKSDKHYLARRIKVEYGWSPTQLLKLIESGHPNRLPFLDDFNDYKGWYKTYGDMNYKDNNLNVKADNSNGALIFLDGSRVWEKYQIDVEANSYRGQVISLIGDLVDNSHNISCNFYSDKLVIKKVDGDKKVEIVKRFRMVNLHGSFTVGMTFGDKTGCLHNGELIWETSQISGENGMGGIGIEIWSQDKDQAELNIKSVNIHNI